MRRFPCKGLGCRYQRLASWAAVSIAVLTVPLTVVAAENPFMRVLQNEDTGDIKLKAEAGDAAAQEKLAGRLEGAHHYAEAAAWYRKAAEAGRAESQYRLGKLLLKGAPRFDADRPALPAQPGTAIGWLTKAAGQNLGQAQLLLGQCYEEGTGAGMNLVTAYKWYLLAAEQTLVGRSFRDRLALKLTASQINEGKRLAAKFMAGDRSDSRIQIVTQAEAAVPERSAETASVVPAVRNAPAPPEPVQPPGLTKSVTQFIKTQKQASAERRVQVSQADPRTTVTRVVVIFMITGLVVGLVKIALAELSGSARRRGRAEPPKASPSASSAHSTAERFPTEVERLQAIDWFQFEKLMALLFAREGYQVDRRGGAAPDGGVDLELSRDGRRTAVQCKHWRNQQVGVKEVREFLGAMSAGRFEWGVFVTISNCTNAAREFAGQNRIELLDGEAVVGLLRKHNAKYDPELESALDAADKRCPKCEARLVRREAKRGANAGDWFWGCSTYPRCHYRLST